MIPRPASARPADLPRARAGTTLAISNSSTSPAPASTFRCAASTRLGRRLVRRTAWSAVSGAGSRRAVRARLRADEAGRVRLGEAAAEEHLLDLAAEALLARQAPEQLAPRRHRERHALELEAGDLLDQVDLARHVAARHVGTVTCQSPATLEAEPLEDLALAFGCGDHADDRVRALGPQAHDRRGREARRARRLRRPSDRRPARRSARSRAAPPARRGTGRRPSPSGSSLPSGGRAARRCAGSRSARSSPPRAAPRSSRRRPRCPPRP